MFLQHILAWIDRAISEVFSLEAWGTGDEEGKHQWTYFISVGRTIGVMGVDGEIRTIMGSRSVHHYYDGKKLLRRIPVRRDLKEGERLATREEIAQHRAEFSERVARTSCGGTII